MSKCKEYILKKTHIGSMKMKRVLELECMIEGFSASEINKALKDLIREGQIYVCRIEKFIKKV